MIAITSRIEYAADQPPSFLARWTSRLALFCVMLIVAAALLHRVFALTTPVAVNIVLTAIGGAVCVLVMAAVAGLDIWITGRQGTARIIMGATIALGILAIPLSLWIKSREWPALADVSTDTENPPQFTELGPRRPEGSNPPAYDREAFEALQRKGYPDIRPLIVPRGAEETFELVLQALGKLKLKTLAEISPASTDDGTGAIELVDTTMIFGFKDDVAIRVSGDESQARVDVRSASQFSRGDFGRNAARIREILREIVGRLEASAPAEGRASPPAAADKDKKAAKKKGIVKRPEAARRPSGAGQHRPVPSRQGTRRGQEQSE